MDTYVFAVQFTLCVCLLLAYTTQTTKVYFCNKFTKNKMSLWPYYLVNCYLVSQTITFGFKTVSPESPDNKNNWFLIVLYALMTNFNCFLWSCVILVQCYEWNLITCLVKFQKDYDLTTWDVKRDMYRNVVEPKEDKKFVLSMIVNVAYHLSRFILLTIHLLVDNGKVTFTSMIIDLIGAAYYVWLLVFFSVCCFSIMY